MHWTSRFADYTRKVVLPPVGYCIYCKASEVRLTTEHPIPNAWGGRLELPASSCETCQKIINEEFEQECLRVLFGTLRQKEGMRGTKKRLKPSTSAIIMDKDGNERRVFAPAKDLPGVILLPLFSGPFCPEGKSGIPPYDMKMWHASIPEEVDTFLKKHGGVRIKTPELNVLKFSRFLAKVAHSMAVAACGTEAFEPFLPELILGRDDDITRVMGAFFEPPSHPSRHFFNFGLIAGPLPDERLLMTDISLFANMGAPRYRVVVGRALHAGDWRFRDEFANAQVYKQERRV